MKALVTTLVPALLIALAQTACAHPNYQDVKAGTNPEAAKPACSVHFQTNELCGDFTWEVQPTESDTGTFVVNFTNPTSGQFVDPVLSLKVVLWMPSMGHGSSPVDITRVSTGVYRVSRVFFSMPGTWQIRFQLKQGSQLVEEQIANVQF